MASTSSRIDFSTWRSSEKIYIRRTCVYFTGIIVESRMSSKLFRKSEDCKGILFIFSVKDIKSFMYLLNEPIWNWSSSSGCLAMTYVGGLLAHTIAGSVNFP